jgi:alcohol dehydrogenase class IV
MYGVGNVHGGARLPLVQVPTTAGTGSEVTPISIITLGAEQKAGVVSPQLLPDVALLDGELTHSLPGHVAAATGVDAMVHAIEAFTSATRKNPLSDLLARESLSLLSGNIHSVSCGGASSADARSAMLLGSCYAGMAFANAPVAAVHALAYPLGARFHVPHGLSNSLMLPHVLSHNAEAEHAATMYAELAPLVLPADALGSTGAMAGARALVDYFTALPAELGLPVTLGEVGVSEDDVPMLAEDAMKQTRLLPNNPREVSLADAMRLYRAAL